MQPAKQSAVHGEYKTLTKAELRAFADEILSDEPTAITFCAKFVVAETKGLWHGRARAMMCRRLKHCSLSRDVRASLLRCILGRLRDGDFSEQFKDQLRLALHLDHKQTLNVCEEAVASPKPFVRRYALWALSLPRQTNSA